METKVKVIIIEEAKKYFFAEDVISFFMISQGLNPDFRKPLSAQMYRLIPRAFNDLVQIVMCYLYCRISVFNPCRSFEANGMMSEGKFITFVQCLENRYFASGYNAQKFLYFCSYVAYIATSFFKVGETNVPKLAVNYIVRTINLYEISEDELWNNLTIAAIKYTKTVFECGFAKMSDFQSMKVQFVVEHPSEEEQDVDNNYGNIENSELIAKEENDLLKLSKELNINPSLIGDYYLHNKSRGTKQQIKKYSKLYKEYFYQKLSSDRNETNAKASLKMEEKTQKNKSETKCTKSQTKEIGLRSISPTRRKRVLDILYGESNEEISPVIPKNKNTNLDNLIKYMSNVSLDMEGLNMSEELNAASGKLDATEDENNSKYFDESRQSVSSSITDDQTYSLRSSQENFNAFISSMESNKISYSASNSDRQFATTSKESEKRYTLGKLSNSEESDIKHCPLKTVEFDICDPFVMKIVSEEKEAELFRETHERFISQEDHFNGTFDILTHAHYMATTYGFDILDIADLLCF